MKKDTFGNPRFPAFSAATLAVLLFACGPLCAEIYKWTDENGQVHFSDQEPVNKQSRPEAVKIDSYRGVSYGDSKMDTGKNVIIFSASWCASCKKAKKYFRRKGIAFREYDIEKSSRGKKLYQELGATGVPVILVGKKRMNGFTEAGFEHIYR